MFYSVEVHLLSNFSFAVCISGEAAYLLYQTLWETLIYN